MRDEELNALPTVRSRLPTDRRCIDRRLIACCLLPTALCLLPLLVPERWTASMKQSVAGVLRPGQVAVLAARDRVASVVAQWKMHWGTVAQLDQAQAEVKQLQEENRRLAAALDAQAARKSLSPADSLADATQRLLRANWIEARVLGQQARAFLGRQQILDAGWRAGVSRETLVMDRAPALIDLGSDAGLEAGRMVATGGRVWGKVVEVGASTSVVRTVTEPGYRDVVRLASPNPQGPPRSGPQGLLEGTGQALARVRLVEATEPVALGDLVYSDAAKGLLPEPLLYGRVVRLERPVGAAYWDIWVEPANGSSAPDRVAVLRSGVEHGAVGQ